MVIFVKLKHLAKTFYIVGQREYESTLTFQVSSIRHNSENHFCQEEALEHLPELSGLVTSLAEKHGRGP